MSCYLYNDDIMCSILQKRNIRTNIRLILFPLFFCVLFVLLQNLVDSQLNSEDNRCGCVCVERNANGQCQRRECGLEYSTMDQAASCPIPNPQDGLHCYKYQVQTIVRWELIHLCLQICQMNLAGVRGIVLQLHFSQGIINHLEKVCILLLLLLCAT